MKLKFFEQITLMNSMRTYIKFSGILLFLLAALFVAPAAAKVPPPPYTPPAPFAPALVPSTSAQFDITGFIQEATLAPAGIAGDPLAGGTLRMNGHLVIVPRNTIVILPATALTWQEIFARAPAPYGLITAAGVPETGLALNDTPRPFTTYEVEVVGNRITTATGNLYIAGLIYISPQFLHSGSGYINFIDYANATMWVGSKLATPMTGTRIQINDPPIINGAGRYSKGLSPDVRFTVDIDNPTITARSAYPMGLPIVLNDPLRPESQRPIDLNPVSPGFGHFQTVFTMTDVANLTAGTDPGPNICRPCDPRLQVPFEVGDFITYSGMLVHDGLFPTAMPATGMPNLTSTYISATTIVDDLSISTFPGSDPAYVRTDVTVLGTGGNRFIGFTEIGARDRFEGFSTDPSRNVHLFGIDVNANASFAPIGATFDRDWGSIDVDPGQEPPPSLNVFGVQRGRWRFRPPTSVLSLPPGGGLLPPTNKGGLRRVAIAGSFLPATREMRAVISQGEVVNTTTMVATNFTLANITVAANGILAGQYHVPILEYIFPENLVGTPQIQNNFADMPFLFDGGYNSSTGVVGGMLNPFPNVWDPAAIPPYIPALNSTFVALEFPTIAVNGTTLFNALPLDQFGVTFTPVTPLTVTFTSSNPAVATINATTGLATGIFPGTAILTATASNGTASFSASATITVTAPVDTFNFTVQAPPGAVAETNVSSISLARGTSGNALLFVMSAAPGSYVVKVNATSANFSSVVTMTVNGSATSAKTTGVNTIATYLLNVTNTGTPTGPGFSVATISTTTTVIGISPTISMLLPVEITQFNSTDPTVTWSSTNTTVGTINSTNGSFTALAPGNTTVIATNASGTFGTALVIVGTSRYTTLPLLPAGNLIIVPVQSDPAFNASRLLELVTAQNPGTAGQKAARWNATNQSVEKFDPFTGPIDFTINASEGYLVNMTANATNISIVGTLTGITQPPLVVRTVNVTPANVTLVVGANQTFTAAALDQFGNPINATVIWSSNNTTVGTINATTGVFTANATGIVLVNATNGTVNGSALVTVIPPSLTTITVAPANAVLVAGVNLNFTATTLDQLGRPINATVIWNSSNPTVGIINATTGVFTALAAGTTTVNATNGSVNGSASMTIVTPPPAAVTTITVAPATATLVVGVNQTFTATALDQLGNPTSARVIWSSNNSAVGTINATTGVFTANATGIVLVNATNGTVNGSALVTVTPPSLTTIIVAPASAVLVAGVNLTFTATTLDQLGRPIAATVTWSSSNPSVGSINSTGVFTALSAGTTVVNATNGTVNGSASVSTTTAQPSVLTTITVTPATASLVAGANQTFTATAHDQLGNPIAATVTWSSSNTTVGTINATTGVFTALSAGTAVVNATNGTVNGSASVTVTPPSLTTITVAPATAVLVAGANQTFTATTLDQLGNPIAATVTWGSSNATVGKIEPATGVFTGLAAGTTTVNASNGSTVGKALVTVTAQTPVLATINVTPATASVVVGNTTNFIAAPKDQFGNSIAAAVTWISSNTTVGTVNTTGVFTANAAGTALVVAINGSVDGSATVTVTAQVPVLTTITVTPTTATVPNSTGSQVFNATARDQNGVPMSGINISWSVSNPAVGSVTPLFALTDVNGNATATFAASAVPGTTFVNATNGTVAGSASVTVIAPPVLTTITVTPATATLATGVNQTFTATALDQYNHPMAGITISWTSSNPTVGSVTPVSATTGLNGNATTTFTPIAGGTAIINATNGSKLGSGTVNVVGSISGHVINKAGSSLPGVSMALTNAAGTAVQTVVTDVNGNYIFAGLVNGAYTVTPSLTGVSFNPKRTGVTINGNNVTGINFQGNK